MRLQPGYTPRWFVVWQGRRSSKHYINAACKLARRLRRLGYSATVVQS